MKTKASVSVPTVEHFMPTLHSRGQRTTEAKPLMGQVELLELARVEPSADNPRDDFSDNDPELVALADSLKANRLLQPIAVARAGGDDDERFTIVAGERRWRAARLAGWNVVPAFVLNVAPQAAAQLMVEENLLRKNLNPIETARAVELLLRPIAEGGAGMKAEEVAKKFGHGLPWVYTARKLLRLPAEWQRQVAAGELEASTAQKLADYADRPDILAAVAADRQANPQDWTGRIGFLASLDRVVQTIDGVSAFAPGFGRPKAAQLAEADVLPLARRSAPVDHARAPESPQNRSGGYTTVDPSAASIVNDGAYQEVASFVEPPDIAPELTTDSRRALLTQIFELVVDLDLPAVDRLQEYLADRRRQLLDLALPQRNSKARSRSAG